VEKLQHGLVSYSTKKQQMEQKTKTDSLHWQMVYIVKNMITGYQYLKFVTMLDYP